MGTPLGPLQGWTPDLRGALRLILPAPAPMALLWGAEGLCLPNGAFEAAVGTPGLLVAPAADGGAAAAGIDDRLRAAGLVGLA